MQLTVMAGNSELELFVNHWKSKSGGEEETEIWRDWQELVLAERVCESQEAGKPLVICGDFNRSAEDFILLNSGKKRANTALRGSLVTTELYSPWFRSDGKFATDTGSYYYAEAWERIDNIMVGGGASIISFSTVTEAPVADEEGIPAAYKIYTEEGCSDHLPLKCVITI